MRKRYLVEDGKVREQGDEEYREWLDDPMRESRGLHYYGEEGRKLAELVVAHGSEIEAFQAEAKERLLAAGLTEDEYYLWHYGALNRQETKRIEDAMRRIR